LVEYKNQFKANKFNDKRIGENDQNLSLEDKMFKRFVVERQVILLKYLIIKNENI
jgi:hypothetical protein